MDTTLLYLNCKTSQVSFDVPNGMNASLQCLSPLDYNSEEMKPLENPLKFE